MTFVNVFTILIFCQFFVLYIIDVSVLLHACSVHIVTDLVFNSMTLIVSVATGVSDQPTVIVEHSISPQYYCIKLFL